MAIERLELKSGTRVRGLVAAGDVTIVAVESYEDILRNVVDHLAAANETSVKLTLEINAAGGAFDERTVRVVRENAGQLNAKSNEFEA